MLDTIAQGVFFQVFNGMYVENTVIGGELNSQRACASRLVGVDMNNGARFTYWATGIGGMGLKKVHFQNFDKSENCNEMNYAI